MAFDVNRAALAVLMMAIAVALGIAAAPAHAAQSPVRVSLSEDPFVCDGFLRPVGVVSGLTAGGAVTFSAPTHGGVFSQRIADATGSVTISWVCTTPATWTITARDATTGRSTDFRIIGAAPSAPTTATDPPATSEPTATPRPTATPQPTATPRPTATPQTPVEDSDPADRAAVPTDTLSQPETDDRSRDESERAASRRESRPSASSDWLTWAAVVVVGLATLITLTTALQLRARRAR